MPKLLVAAPLLLAASYLLADQVVLNNGDRLTGTIVKSDGKHLVLKTDYAGEITIHWDALQGLASSGPLHIGLKSGQTLVGHRLHHGWKARTHHSAFRNSRGIQGRRTQYPQ